MNIIKTVATRLPNTAVSVSLFHHPYTWISADVAVSFRDHIERISDIVLTGHQHYDHAYFKHTLKDERVFYGEGDVLQDSCHPEHSGFRTILLDLAAEKRQITRHVWNSTHYTPENRTEWMQYSRKKTDADPPRALATYIHSLSDSGLGLVHHKKGRISLDAIFIYPDVSVRQFASTSASKDIRGPNLLDYISERPRVLIQGGPQTGKTSLAKSLVRDWLAGQAYYPVLLRGGHISRADQSFTDSLIKSMVSAMYGKDAVEQYRQMPTSAKVLVIDDWNASTLTSKERVQLLKQAEIEFGKIVLLVDGLSFADQVLARANDDEVLLSYDHMTVGEMSHVSRGHLIERWLGLDFPRESPEFSRSVEETERLINSVIGKNTLPSLPFIVLSLLQASQERSDVLPENGSFGYLYEVLITASLNWTRRDKAQLDKKYTFLSLLAFQLFVGSTEVMGLTDLHALLDKYRRTFKVKLDEEALLAARGETRAKTIS